MRRSRQWSALRSAAFLIRFPSRSPDFRNRGNSSSSCDHTIWRASSRSVCLILTRRASGGSKSRTPIIRRKRGEATFSIGRGPGSDSPQIPIAIVKMRRTLRGDALREWRTRLPGKASPLKPTTATSSQTLRTNCVAVWRSCNGWRQTAERTR